MSALDTSPSPRTRPGHDRVAGPVRHAAIGAAEPGLVGALAALWLCIPARWAAELGPFPDADEYALAARSLARGHAYVLTLLDRPYPPRYPFGFSALIAPMYWLPHATLANGIYGVIGCGALTAVLTYLLARAIGGRAAGIIAAVALLAAPQFLHWNHEVMSETATTALTAAIALLVYRLVARDRGATSLYTAPLLMLGGVLGFALLARLTNVVFLIAVGGSLLADRRTRAGPLRVICLVGLGPLVAIIALATYAYSTFGGVTGTGYRYWVPYWYASLHRTFALSYAIRAPGSVGDAYAPSDTPNLLYYARGIAGLLPRPSLTLFSIWLFLAMLLGFAILARDPRHAVRIYCLFAALVAVSTVGIYAIYFFQSVRFMAPLLPLGAVGIGVTLHAGVRWIRGFSASAPAPAMRGGRWPLRATGVVLCGLVLVALGSAFGSVAGESYIVRNRFQHQQWPEAYPIEARIAGLYRGTVPAGSIVVTDVALPLLEGASVTRRATVIPLSRGGYLSMPPFDDVPSLAGQADAIAGALEVGREVFTDNFSLGSFDTSPGATPQSVGQQIVEAYARDPVATAGPAVLYRLTARPDTGAALLRARGAGAMLVATPDSGTRGTTTHPLVIQWDTRDDRTGEVTVAQGDGGEQLFARGTSGAQPVTWLAPHTSYIFRLYAGNTQRTLLRTLIISLDVQ